MGSARPRRSSPWPYLPGAAGAAAVRVAYARKRRNAAGGPAVPAASSDAQPDVAGPSALPDEPRRPGAGPAAAGPGDGREPTIPLVGPGAPPDPLSVGRRAALEARRGEQAEAAGRYAEAEEHFVRSAEGRIAAASGQQSGLGEWELGGIADDFYRAADNAEAAGHPGSSVKLFTAALESVRSAMSLAGPSRGAAAARVRHNRRGVELSCLYSLGELALHRAERVPESDRAVPLGEAQTYFRTLYDTAVADEATGSAGLALEGLAMVLMLGGGGDPVPYLEQAADAHEANGSGVAEAEVHWRLAAWAYEHGDTERAFDRCQRALGVRRRNKDSKYDDLYSLYEGRSAHLLAAMAADRDDSQLAGQWLDEAAALLERAGDDAGVEAARRDLAGLAADPDGSVTGEGITEEEDER